MTVLREVLPCRRCQQPTAGRDPVVATFPFCASCSDESVNEFTRAQAEFESLLAHGVDRRMANRIMMERTR